MNSMKLKTIKKYDGGTKGIKTDKPVSIPSFANKIKPLTSEQKAKGDSINTLDKKKKLFKDGGKDIGSDIPTSKSGGSKPVVKETTTTSTGSKGTSGSAKIIEETVQKTKSGKVETVAGFKDPKNIDRSGQTSARQKALDEAKKNLDSLPHGHKITYKAPNGSTQHAGRVEKTEATPATPPKKETIEKMRLTTPNSNTSSSKNSSGKQVMGSSEVAKNKAEHQAKGEYFQNGQYIKTKNSTLKSKEDIKSRPLNKNKAVVDDAKTQKKLVTKKFKDGTNKMKLMKKGSKMC